MNHKITIVINSILIILASLFLAYTYTVYSIKNKGDYDDKVNCKDLPLMTSCVVKEVSTQKAVLQDDRIYIENNDTLEDVTETDFFTPRHIYNPQNQDRTNCYKTTRLYSITNEYKLTLKDYPTKLITRCGEKEDLINYFYLPFYF